MAVAQDWPIPIWRDNSICDQPSLSRASCMDCTKRGFCFTTPVYYARKERVKNIKNRLMLFIRDLRIVATLDRYCL